MGEKNNNKGLIWLVIILIFLVLGLVGFIIYDKVLLKDKECLNENNSTTNTTIQNESNSTTNTTTQNESIVTYDYIYIDKSIKDNDIQNAYTIVSNVGFLANGYKWDFGEKKELSYNDLTEKEKNAMVLSYLIMNKKVISKDAGNTYKISKNDFSNAIYNVFGNVDYNWSEEFGHNENIYTLTEDNDYEMNLAPTGREGDNEIYILLDSKKTDQEIEITVAYYYVTYAMLEDETLDGNVYDKNNNRICLEKDVKNHINDLQQYKFIFEKQENHYVFNKIIKFN